VSYLQTIQDKRQTASQSSQSQQSQAAQSNIVKQLQSIEQATRDANSQKPGAMTARQQKLFDTVREILETDEQRTASENHEQTIDALGELKKSMEDVSQTTESSNKGVLGALQDVIDAVQSLDMAPVVNLPAPVVNIPQSKINVASPELNLRPLQDTIRECFKAPEVADDRLDLSRYRAQDISDSPDKQYIGFLSPEGGWYIIENDIKRSAMRYVFGNTSYAKAFKKAASYQYMLLDEAIDAAS
jgi:hypothetical protein